MFYKIFKFKLQLTTKLSEIPTLKFIYKQWYVLSLKKKKIFYFKNVIYPIAFIGQFRFLCHL